MSFNPRAYVRRDATYAKSDAQLQSFNPRAYVRRDPTLNSLLSWREFQSTRLRETRLLMYLNKISRQVSIHAPT